MDNMSLLDEASDLLTTNALKDAYASWNHQGKELLEAINNGKEQCHRHIKVVDIQSCQLKYLYISIL